MRKRVTGILGILLYVAGSLWILIYQTSNVFGNLEASYIWGIPGFAAFVVSHTSMHKKINNVNNKLDKQTENINGN